jgi:oligoendopeptidase F
LRQNYFIKFELLAHKMLMKGCSEKELSDAYLKLLCEQLGSSVNVQDQFRYEWAYIPHIYHSPFYCYAYNFGELLSLALFARYKKVGPSFVPSIEKVLAAGGSQDPVTLLKSIGVDIHSAAFWCEGFTIIKEWLKELENVV